MQGSSAGGGGHAPRSHIAITKSAERERGIHGAKEIGKAESAWTRSASAETRKATGTVHGTPPPSMIGCSTRAREHAVRNWPRLTSSGWRQQHGGPSHRGCTHAHNAKSTHTHTYTQQVTLGGIHAHECSAPQAPPLPTSLQARQTRRLRTGEQGMLKAIPGVATAPIRA